MNADTARDLLLAQHEAIRAGLAGCVAIANRLRANEASEEELERALEQIRADVYHHNLTETQLMRPLLTGTRRSGDRLGEEMVEQMIDEHVAEHVAMWTVMNQPAIVIALELAKLAAVLDAHMAAEERTFLTVLRSVVSAS